MGRGIEGLGKRPISPGSYPGNESKKKAAGRKSSGIPRGIKAVSVGNKLSLPKGIDETTESHFSLKEKIKDRRISLFHQDTTIFKNNRLGKDSSNLEHTYVLFQGKNNESCRARLLNSMPESELLKKGFTEKQCKTFEKNDKGELFLGAGGYGKVKFAEIAGENKGEKIIVAAKKIKTMDDMPAEDVKKEIDLQKKAGSAALKVYGISNTVDKKGEPECIVFMEIAKGLTFESLIKDDTEIDVEQKELIARNLLSVMETSHHNSVFQRDIKPQNIFVNVNDDCSVKFIDFGNASDSSIDKQKLGFQEVPFFSPPEWSMNNVNLENEKIDIFGLGVTLIDLYKEDASKENPFFLTYHGKALWDESSPEENEIIIKEKLNRINLREPGKSIIPKMLSFNPDDRPSLFQVQAELGFIDPFESW